MKYDLQDYEKGDIVVVSAYNIEIGVLESIEKKNTFILRYLNLGRNNIICSVYPYFIYSYSPASIQRRTIYTGRNVFRDSCLSDEDLKKVYKVFSKYHPKRKEQLLKTTHYDKARALLNSRSSENINIFSSI